MFGITLRYDISKFTRQVRAFAFGLHSREVFQKIGAFVLKQTDKRIEREKESPDGFAWPAWSKRYAETRHANHSLLISTGRMQTSFAYRVLGDSVEIGTALPYAAFHQKGTRRMPKRELMGLSARNKAEIENSLERFLAAKIGARHGP